MPVALPAQFINFSKRKVETTESFTVQNGEQMAVFGPIENYGNIVNLGQIVLATLEDKDIQQFIPPPDPENFSHRSISTDGKKTIESGQQMHVIGAMEVYGVLENLGQVVVSALFQKDAVQEMPSHEENFSFHRIDPDKVIKINPGQQMSLVGPIENNGILINLGSVVLQGVVNTDIINSFPLWTIPSGDVMTIPHNRFYRIPTVQNYGNIINNGIVLAGV